MFYPFAYWRGDCCIVAYSDSHHVTYSISFADTITIANPHGDSITFPLAIPDPFAHP